MRLVILESMLFYVAYKDAKLGESMTIARLKSLQL